jgi:outer membrane protein
MTGDAILARPGTTSAPIDAVCSVKKETLSMKYLHTRNARLAVAALTLVGLGALAAEPGWTAEAFKMGVVDPQAVLEKSKAGRRALDGLKEHATSRQKLLAKDEEELKTLEKQMKEQESGLSEAKKREIQGQFRTKIQDYQKRVQDFNQELAGKQKELVDDYMKRIQVATKAVAEKSGVALVVDKGSDATIKIVIYNKETIDLTDLVIREFDKLNK